MSNEKFIASNDGAAKKQRKEYARTLLGGNCLHLNTRAQACTTLNLCHLGVERGLILRLHFRLTLILARIGTVFKILLPLQAKSFSAVASTLAMD